MPEHEAARCLLSLSMTPPAPPISGSQQQQSNQTIHQFSIEKSSEPKLDEITCRRIITFAAPKSEFDLHGQYYSDPNLNKPNEIMMNENANDSPMDLTKRPRMSPIVHQQYQAHMQQYQHSHHHHVKASVSDVVTPITAPHSLLASLVKITDKFPMMNQNGDYHISTPIDEMLLPQKYITDRALLDSKMKQSQMKVSESTRVITSCVTSMVSTVDVKPQTPERSRTTSDEAGISMMETLAEVAASSVKLDVSSTSQALKAQRHQRHSESSSEDIGSKMVTPKGTDNAKSVASEYLKLFQNVNKQGEKLSECDEESGSDQEAILDKLHPDLKGIVARKVVVGEDGFNRKKNMSSDPLAAYSRIQEDGRPVCTVCLKTFQKPSQLRIHINIHYMERKFRCEACAVSFRTQGHLLKHERSLAHQNKVSMTSTFGVPTQTNPRPFKCKECKVAFRIHGHLAKHLRSKLHVLKLECLQKLPFGTYAEIERAGINLTNIDTSDCDSSLASLQDLAQKLHEKDPSKLGPVNRNALNNSNAIEDDQITDIGIGSGGNDSDTEDGDSDGNIEIEDIQTKHDTLNGLKPLYNNLNQIRHEMNHGLKDDTMKNFDPNQDPLDFDSQDSQPCEKRLKTSNNDT